MTACHHLVLLLLYDSFSVLHAQRHGSPWPEHGFQVCKDSREGHLKYGRRRLEGECITVFTGARLAWGQSARCQGNDPADSASADNLFTFAWGDAPASQPSLGRPTVTDEAQGVAYWRVGPIPWRRTPPRHRYHRSDARIYTSPELSHFSTTCSKNFTALHSIANADLIVASLRRNNQL